MTHLSPELAKCSEAIARLPPRTREIFELHRFERMSYADIALDFGIAKHTVIVHMERALSSLPHEEGAAAWLARMRDTDTLPAERARFSAWLAADERHRKAWSGMNRIWASLDALEHTPVDALPPPMEVEPPRRKTTGFKVTTRSFPGN